MPDPQNYAGGLTLGNRKGPKAPGDAYEPARKMLKLERNVISPLDSPQAQRIHSQLMGWYTHELDTQANNRIEMAMDDDFFDHIQWTDEELATLADRGQAPIVFNITQTTINWVLGTQRRAPLDFKILPRTKAGQAAAQRKTELLKHIADENRSTFEVSAAFGMAVKVGLGWLECGQGQPEEGTQVYDRHEDWRCMLWDSTSRRYDLLDARYIFRTKWLDTDVATNLWSGRKGLIEMAAGSTVLGMYDGDDLGDDAMDSVESAHFGSITGMSSRRGFGSDRQRVRVVECWFKMPVPDALLIKGGQFNGELFDEWSPGHWSEVKEGLATLVTRPREVIHVALMTDGGLLDLRRSPYRHNRYPFTPVWGYRRARDGMPYGMIRGIRDVQRDLNKRGSKALHHLSSTRVTMVEGAVDDVENLRNEAGRPDAVIVYKDGKPAPAIHVETNLAAAHIELMDRDASMIREIGGITNENLGRPTTAKSGIAIQRLQDQGALSTSLFFENLRQSRQIHGEKQIVLTEMYYDKREEFLITDQRGNPDFKVINDGAPENDIASFKAKFVISEEDWRATSRQAEADALLELGGKLAATAPQIVVSILDLVVESMDIKNKDEIVKRIRQITGVDDPDADPNNPTPEMAAKQEAAAQQEQLAQRQLMAVLGEQEAKARKITAEAAKAEAALSADGIARLKAAFEVAIAIAGAPAVAAAADQILMEATKEEARTAPAAAEVPQQPQPMPQQAQQPMQPPAPEEMPMQPPAEAQPPLM